MNNLLKNLEPSSTLELNQLAKSMAAAGKSIVNLTAGEPDFNTPERIQLAAIKAMKEGKTKYTHTSGIPELRTAVKTWAKHQYNRDYSLDEILISNGGKQAIFNLCYALLNPGDEVIIPSPCWVSYKSMVEMIGAEAIIIPSGIENNFEPDLKIIESRITPKTKLLILNSPNNPSGAVFSKNFFHRLENLIEKHSHFYILTDDIYEKFVYDKQPFYSIGMSAKISKERLIIIGGVSKTYSMTGWRVGYALASKEIISVMGNVQSQTTSNVSSISQWAALEALQGSSDNEINQFLELFQKRRDLAFTTISKISGVKCLSPAGAFYIFPNIENYLGKTTQTGRKIHTDADLAYYLLEEYGLASVPGSAFGSPGYIRFSFVVTFEQWNDGISRFEKALKALKD
jgi:aspartate aminotransferase